MSTSTTTSGVLAVLAVGGVLHASSGSALAQWPDCSVEDCSSEDSGWAGGYELDFGISTERALTITAIPLGVATTVMTLAQISSRSANDGVARKGWVVAGFVLGIVDIVFGAIVSGHGLSTGDMGFTALGVGAIALGGVSFGLAVTNPSSSRVRAGAGVRPDGATLTLSSRF